MAKSKPTKKLAAQKPAANPSATPPTTPTPTLPAADENASAGNGTPATPAAPVAKKEKQTSETNEVYEPHSQNKPEYKASDVAYGRKRPCMLADGSYPDTVTETE